MYNLHYLNLISSFVSRENFHWSPRKVMKYFGQNFTPHPHVILFMSFFGIPLLYIKANASIKCELNFYLQAAIWTCACLFFEKLVFFFHSVTLIHCRKVRKVCQQFIKSFLALNQSTANEKVHGFLIWKDGVAFYVRCCHGSSRSLSSNKQLWGFFLVYLPNLLLLLFS